VGAGADIIGLEAGRKGGAVGFGGGVVGWGQFGEERKERKR